MSLRIKFLNTAGVLTAAALAMVLGADSAKASTLYSYTGSVQTVTIATSGTYEITASGAQGGGDSGGSTTGGLGAFVDGDVTLTAGEVLQIVVAVRAGTAVRSLTAGAAASSMF